jgi:hypothetical protein
MMTTVNFGKLKSDIIDHMVTEGLLANQSDKMTTSNVNTCSSMNALSAEDANNDKNRRCTQNGSDVSWIEHNFNLR